LTNKIFGSSPKELEMIEGFKGPRVQGKIIKTAKSKGAFFP